MLKAERHQKILEYLKQHHFVRVDQLAQAMQASEITIRRDIIELDQKQKLVKVHGGARSFHEKDERIDIDVYARSLANTEAKRIIAELASDHLDDKANVYLDAGSTTALLIPYLKDKNLKVFTHGVHHVEAMARLNIPCHLIGGDIKASTFASVGTASMEYLSQFHFDIAFMGSNAVDKDFGYSTPDINEAMMKRKIIENSDESYILADSSKFDKKSNVSFADISIPVITDKKPPLGYDTFHIIYPKE